MTPDAHPTDAAPTPRHESMQLASATATGGTGACQRSVLEGEGGGEERTTALRGQDFSSARSSLKMRQSVPSVINFWGVDLMKPVSRIRKA